MSNKQSGSGQAPRESQASEAFDTPTRDEIIALTAPHVESMEADLDGGAWGAVGMKFLLITLVGRKSGTVRKTPLPYWYDADDHRIITASFAGDPKNPMWYLNLADKTANPTIEVQDRHHIYTSVPEILEGDDYKKVWAEMTADRPYYNDYQAKTDRQIPLIRIAES